MNPKKIRIPPHALLFAACVFLGVLLAPAQEGDAKPMLRLICANGTAEAQQAVLASKKENGQWNRLGGTEIRGTMVSDWLPSLHGELHILLKQDGKPVSVCHFTHPAGTRRALVVLSADEKEKGYRAHVTDPEKEGFAAGTTLIINASEVTGTVSLGTETLTVEAGRHLVAKPAPDENGGYRLMVHYPDEQDAKQLCYDRQAITNPKSRNILVLLPDPNVTLRVVSISEFDPFE